ncbi:uncharacterized protein ACR2FA_006629 [Aphomia sociella]
MNNMKGPPLTKQEVNLLISLIRDHNVIMSKQTTADSNRLKEKAWQHVTEQFNSRIRSCPRRANQLRLKWDNLKKSARRRMANKKHETQNGYFATDEILDTVLMLLESTSDSADSGSNGENGTRKTDDSDMDVEINQVIRDTPQTFGDPLYKAGNVSSGTHSEIDTDSENETEEEIEAPTYSDVIKSKSRARVTVHERRKSDVVRKNIAIAEYYEAKKRKIELEITKLQLDIDSQINNGCSNCIGSSISRIDCNAVKQEDIDNIN